MKEHADDDPKLALSGVPVVYWPKKTVKVRISKLQCETYFLLLHQTLFFIYISGFQIKISEALLMQFILH